jgi:hypothetical protein
MGKIIEGYSEAEERMGRDKDEPNKMVALDHDFYTNNHSASHRKEREVHNSIHNHHGDDVGYQGEKEVKAAKSPRREDRNKFAIGGAIKERRGFYK